MQSKNNCSKVKKDNCHGGGRHKKWHCSKKMTRDFLNSRKLTGIVAGVIKTGIVLKIIVVLFVFLNDKRLSEFKKGNCHFGGRHEKWHCFKN